MRLEVDVGGRTRVLDVSASTAGFLVSLDGRPITADVIQVGHSWSLLIDDRSYDVSVIEESPGHTVVFVDGHRIPVSVSRMPPGGSRRSRDGSSSPGAAGPHRVVAPMPGKIVRVLVAAGQAVAARQGLVVVEAMKMENELRSPRAGTVTDVRVVEGALVDAGTLLLIVE